MVARMRSAEIAFAAAVASTFPVAALSATGKDELSSVLPHAVEITANTINK
jgi:hypothetical protein